MVVINIRAECKEVPFREPFSHSSKTRGSSASIFVSIELEDGNIGWGEGCPREYVTSESLASSYLWITEITPDLMSIRSLKDLVSFVDENKNQIDQAPAAWCAIELAFLDALGRAHGKTLEALLELAKVPTPLCYSAIIGSCDLLKFKQASDKYYSLGMSDFKLKTLGDAELDGKKLSYLSSLYKANMRVRLDGNNCWNNSAVVEKYLLSLPFLPWAIEEPLSQRDLSGLGQVNKNCSVKIIIDESCTTLKDLEALSDYGDDWIINLRVSKLGGLLRSIALLRRLESLNLRKIVGAHVGESSILTRASIALIAACATAPVAIEGAFGTYLLSKDICLEPLMFAEGGKIGEHPYFSRAGLGLDWLNEEKV